jgi:hypothetical protein
MMKELQIEKRNNHLASTWKHKLLIRVPCTDCKFAVSSTWKHKLLIRVPCTGYKFAVCMAQGKQMLRLQVRGSYHEWGSPLCTQNTYSLIILESSYHDITSLESKMSNNVLKRWVLGRICDAYFPSHASVHTVTVTFSHRITIMIYFHKKFQLCFFITNKQKYIYYAAVIMLFCFPQNIPLPEVAHFFKINYHKILIPYIIWHYCHSQLRSFLRVMLVLLMTS